MARDSDEEALSWGTSSDPSHIEAPPRVVEADDVPEGATQTSSALLVVYGIIAGAFLLFAVGWLLVLRFFIVPEGVLPVIMFRLSEVLAVASPVLWFLGTLLLTRRAKPAVRLLWMLLGLAVTAPWPFILGAFG